jgi:uncharacterized protein (TIGR02466 family)
MNVHNLFPTPVAYFDLGRELTDGETEFLMGQEQRPNQGNMTSKDNFVLRHKAMTGLRQFIEDSMAEYFAATANPKGNVHLRITQSWLNYTEPGQYHHKHAHPNSLVSGVFYVKANPETDKIYFYRDGYQQIKLPPKDWNLYNSESWWLSVGTGQLVLFPSSLTHMVETVTGDDTRISLAFNTFPVGNVGDELNLTGLNLEETDGALR